MFNSALTNSPWPPKYIQAWKNMGNTLTLVIDLSIVYTETLKDNYAYNAQLGMIKAKKAKQARSQQMATAIKQGLSLDNTIDNIRY